MFINHIRRGQVKICSNFSIKLRSFYDWKTKSQTIFAPATSILPERGSPLAIVRVSGPLTKQVVQDLTSLKPFDTLKPRYTRHSKIFDRKRDELIDVGLVIWFPGPNSYTGEDVCEFHIHGSRAIMSKLLTVLSDMGGLRPAEPGEFTRRALQNNKISLMQAESLPDLIKSQTDNQRRLALNGLSGTTRLKYDQWIGSLISILAHLEASIDFGEDELLGEQQVVNDCMRKLRELTANIEHFIEVGSRSRDLVQQGVNVTILGRPNAGKSTFMNLLCRQERSIVSDLSGTTRDVVEHSFDFCGQSLTLSDTAGLQDLESLAGYKVIDTSTSESSVIDKHNSIEREGMRRAIEAARKAHVLVYLVDGSKTQGANEIIREISEILNILNNQENRLKSVHVVVNKSDLNQGACDDSNMVIDGLMAKVRNIQIASISCKTGHNFELFLKNLDASFKKLHSIGETTELNYVNERHLALLQSVQKHLDAACLMDIETIDEMAQHVRESVDYLSRIVGTVTNEQVIDVIFRDFCIGK